MVPALFCEQREANVSPLILMSFRNLSRNRRRTLLALGAVVVGLCALTMIRGFVNSVRQAQLSATIYGTTGMMQVHRAGYLKNVLSNPLDLAFADTPELRQKFFRSNTWLLYRRDCNLAEHCRPQRL